MADKGRVLDAADVIRVRDRRPAPVIQKRLDRLLSHCRNEKGGEGTVPLAQGYFTLERMRNLSVAKLKTKGRKAIRGS